MDNKKELKSFTDGTYVFQETELQNQFYFYRADGQLLGEINREPMDMYQNYICMKMFEGDIIPQVIANNIRFETSADGKCIRLTTYVFGEKEITEQPEQKSIKKLVKSIFRSKRK